MWMGRGVWVAGRDFSNPALAWGRIAHVPCVGCCFGVRYQQGCRWCLIGGFLLYVTRTNLGSAACQNCWKPISVQRFLCPPILSLGRTLNCPAELNAAALVGLAGGSRNR